MTEIKNIFKVFETSERVTWEEEIPCHRDDIHTYIHTHVRTYSTHAQMAHETKFLDA
jgi:hypothetical protein